jgi:hypothetical protein
MKRPISNSHAFFLKGGSERSWGSKRSIPRVRGCRIILRACVIKILAWPGLDLFPAKNDWPRTHPSRLSLFQAATSLVTTSCTSAPPRPSSEKTRTPRACSTATSGTSGRRTTSSADELQSYSGATFTVETALLQTAVAILPSPL